LRGSYTLKEIGNRQSTFGNALGWSIELDWFKFLLGVFAIGSVQ
jgi:hypothetical protein